MKAFLALLMLATHAAARVEPGGTIRIEGKVVDAEGNPASDAEIFVTSVDRNQPDRRKATKYPNSRQDGSFTLDLVAPRDPKDLELPITIWTLREDTSITGFAFFWNDPPEKSFTIKLARKNHEAIVVSDFVGNPVEGVRITPTGLYVDGLPEFASTPPEELVERLGATTDAAGKAVIERATPKSIRRLRAQSERFGVQYGRYPLKGRAFDLAEVGRIRGRLKADDPKAVQGRLVRVESVSSPYDNAYSKTASEIVRSDQEGKFEIPAFIRGELFVTLVDRRGDQDYRDFRLGSSGILLSGRTLDLVIPLATSPRYRSEALTGRILDSKGDPVPTATVFSRGDTYKTLTAVTDQNGAYRLEGVPKGLAFVFVRKPGYRFAGALVPQDKTVLDVMIRRDDEKPDRPLKTLPTPLGAEERNALARKVIDPKLERLLQEGVTPRLSNCLRITAMIDPELVLDLVARNVFNNEGYDDLLRHFAACGFINQNVDDALAVAESIHDIRTKIGTYYYMWEYYPKNDRVKKLDMLSRARLQADNQKDPIERIVAIGRIADALFDLVEDAAATKILRDSLADAIKLPIDGPGEGARITFAKALASIDPPLALELVNDIKNIYNLEDTRGEIAHRIAARFPAESERLLSLLGYSFTREYFPMRVAYRMAPRDYDRARRIAFSIPTEKIRAYTLGIMAENLAESDNKLAQKLLQEAFDTLENIVGHAPQLSRLPGEPAEIAAALVAVAEKIDPALVDEYFWRAVSIRTLPRSLYELERHLKTDAVVAAILARFNPSIARLLIKPIDVSTIDFSRIETSISLYALAAIDPRGAIDLFNQIPEPDPNDTHHFKNGARSTLALMLAHRDEEFWKYFISNFAQLWIPDVENSSRYP